MPTIPVCDGSYSLIIKSQKSNELDRCVTNRIFDWAKCFFISCRIALSRFSSVPDKASSKISTSGFFTSENNRSIIIRYFCPSEIFFPSDTKSVSAVICSSASNKNESAASLNANLGDNSIFSFTLPSKIKDLSDT